MFNSTALNDISIDISFFFLLIFVLRTYNYRNEIFPFFSDITGASECITRDC